MGSTTARLLASAAVSAIGDGFTIVAFGLLAVRATDDARLVALVFLAERVPWAVGLPLARLVDRCRCPARVLVAADLGRAIVLAVAAWLIGALGPSVPILVGAGFLLGAGTLLHSAARSTLLPVVASGAALARANGYLAALEGLGYAAIGPALGGLVFAFDASLPLALDGVTFVASAVCVAPLLRFSLPSRSSGAGQRRRGLVRAVLADPLLSVLLGQAFVLGFTQSMVLAVTPIFVQRELGVSPGWYGVFLGAAAVGGITTGFVTPHLWEDRRNTSALVIGAGVAAGLAYIALADRGAAITAVAMLFVYDSTVGIMSTVAPTLRFERAPADAQGATATLFRQVILGVQPVGALLSGLIARAHGVRTSMTLAGLVMVACFAGTALPFRRAAAATGA